MPANQPEGNINETIGQVIGLLGRRCWWILLPALVISLAGIGYALRLPDQYRSEATLVVVQPQVPQRYVEAMTTTPTPDIVNGMKREILSRTRLLSVIEAFGLYPQYRGKLSAEQLAEVMRKDVLIAPLDSVPGRYDFNAFTVSFAANNARLAQEVTSRLTSLFIEENLRSRGSQAATTIAFITDRLEEAKQRLMQQEQRLQEFKLSNHGSLPGQEQTAGGAMTDLRLQMQIATAGLSRAGQQRTSLESALKGALARFQSEKATLLSRFTARHPEVTNKQRDIAKTEALLMRLKNGQPVVDKPDGTFTLDDPLVAQLTTQVEANVTETQSLLADQQRSKAEFDQYQGRLRLAPIKEQQLASIMRDYELYRQDYSDLVSKQLRAKLSSSLEEEHAGQTFRLIDVPTLPAAPSGPSRLKISLGGLGAGLALGLALGFLMEFRDRSFHSEAEVRRSLGVPLLVSIPMIRTELEVRRLGRKRIVEWAAGSAIALIILAAEFYVYRFS